MSEKLPKFFSCSNARGYSLVEMMIVLGLVGIASLAAWLVLSRMTAMRLDAMSFASISSETTMMTQLVRKRFLTRVGGNNGVCAGTSPFIPNAAPGIGYCLGNCTSGTSECKTFTIRRGSAALFEDITWQSECVAAPAAIAGRLPSGAGVFASQCGLNCSAGQVPRVLISTRKVPTPGTPTITTRTAPAGFGLAGAAPTLTSAIGAEICMTLNDAGLPDSYGSVVVSGRTYGFGLGEAQRRRVRFEDAVTSFPELVLANDSLIFEVNP